jgi:hypothetical protein
MHRLVLNLLFCNLSKFNTDWQVKSKLQLIDQVEARARDILQHMVGSINTAAVRFEGYLLRKVYR